MKSVNPLSSKKNTREDELATLRSTGSQHESIRSKLKNMGPICKSRKESAAAFLQSSIEEEIDLDMQFGEEKCSDDSTYTCYHQNIFPHQTAYQDQSLLLLMIGEKQQQPPFWTYI